MVSSLISSIQGSLESVGPDRVDISVGGVTFQINVPASTGDGIGRVGDHVRLFTSLQVREDSLTLYGFLTEDSRTAFETLIGISGIGPKVALSVLSRFTPASLAVAVSAADTDAFVGVPGVGK
ncbi:MAG: Holliday junction branch migration protein RuvA, partial [Chloroflexi bacterium]|nr:Holliday junction branch migration protein RuvA [Chloroflexota bacterium]